MITRLEKAVLHPIHVVSEFGENYCPCSVEAVLALITSKEAAAAMWAAPCSLTGAPTGKHPECAQAGLARWLNESVEKEDRCPE